MNAQLLMVIIQELMVSLEITAIEEEWLPVIVPELCTFSSPLDTPTPRYDPASDRIVCHMNSTYGIYCIDYCGSSHYVGC